MMDDPPFNRSQVSSIRWRSMGSLDGSHQNFHLHFRQTEPRRIRSDGIPMQMVGGVRKECRIGHDQPCVVFFPPTTRAIKPPPPVPGAVWAWPLKCLANNPRILGKAWAGKMVGIGLATPQDGKQHCNDWTVHATECCNAHAHALSTAWRTSDGILAVSCGVYGQLRVRLEQP